MALKLALAALLASGCVRADRATLASSSALLACDWMATRSSLGTIAAPDAMSPNGYVVLEVNPLLGPTPSTSQVDAYFAASMALNAAVWALLPARARTPFGAGVTGLEAYTVAVNTRWAGVCGL